MFVLSFLLNSSLLPSKIIKIFHSEQRDIRVREIIQMQSKLNNIDYRESLFLNILRGLAIFAVIAMHSAQAVESISVQHESSYVREILYLGRYGVEVVFFLSGWLLAALYGFQGDSISKGFFRRRLARIYPLWVIFLIIYFLLGLFYQVGGFYQSENSNFDLQIVKDPLVITILALTFTLFLSSNLWNSVIPGSWSIQSEICHYILFSFIRRYTLEKLLSIVSVINIISVLLLLVNSKIESNWPALYALVSTWLRLGLYSTFSFFLAGIMTHRYFRSEKEESLDAFWKKKSFACYILTSVCVNCPQGIQIEAIGYVFCNLLIAYALIEHVRIGNFFSFLGKYSYFLYFYHFLVIQFTKSFLNSSHTAFNFQGDQIVVFTFIFVLALACSLALAIPSYRFIESPIIRHFR